MQGSLPVDDAARDAAELRFSPADMPFGRRLSHMSVSEATLATESGDMARQLCVAKPTRRYYAITTPDEPQFPGLMSLRPYRNGASVGFASVATPGLLRADAGGGAIELCFDAQDLLRVRATGVGLRIYAPLKEHEAAIDRLDGTYQVSFFDGVGELLLVPLSGRHTLHSRWDWRKAGTDDLLLDVEPDESGTLELCVHYAVANTFRLDAYRPFDACAREAAEDFRRWYDMYPPVPARYEHTKRVAAYSVWICYVGALGRVKGKLLTFDKWSSAFSWHSAFAAMALRGDPDTAVDMLLTPFDYQDGYGQLPDMIDDRYVNYLATKPPYQGAAVLYLMDRLGERLTEAHCERLYAPLVRWHDWWMTMRDTDRDGVPQYNQGCESGLDCSEALARGVPVECPDIIAYIILLEEALGRLARRTRREAEADEWLRRSGELTRALVRCFWDGERFVARVSTTHEIVDIPGVQAYLPVMLGRRLPADVLDAICERLDADYLTPHGLKSYADGEPTKPPYDYYSGFDQLRAAVGLCDAGRTELAWRLARGYCDENAAHLPRMGYLYGERPPSPGIRTELYYEDYGKCSSLSCSIFLVLAGLLCELGE